MTMYLKVSTFLTGITLSAGFLRRYSVTAGCDAKFVSQSALLGPMDNMVCLVSVQWIMFSWNVPPMTTTEFCGQKIGNTHP